MYRLFIDESGKNTLKDPSTLPRHFSMGGALVHQQSSDFIKKRGDQIKFKYWGHTHITFHAVNIRRLDGDFSIFSDEKDPLTGQVIIDRSIIRNDFYNDLIEYIKLANFKFICICVNKDLWAQKNPALNTAILNKWSTTGFEKQLTRTIFEEVVKVYLCYLSHKKMPGQIIVEASDIKQDGDILSTYNEFMFKGMQKMGMDSNKIRDILTCISFATKNNLDHETQLADMGMYFITLQARKDDNMPCTITPFDTEMIRVFETKSFKDRCDALNTSSIRRL